MLVTVFCAPRDRPESTFALDVSPELELRDFVALCELESGIPAGEIQILYIEQALKDPTRALGNYGVKDGDVVVLRQADRRPPPTQPSFPGLPHIDFRSITVPGSSSSNQRAAALRQQNSTPQQQQQQQQRSPQQPTPVRASAPGPSSGTGPSAGGSGSGSSPQGLDDPALLQQMLLANPHELSLLKERNPPLAEALLSGDLERFTKVLQEQQQDRSRREQERIRLLTADPFDLDAQAKIEEDIRQHNVEENMTIAMEEAPESFGQVVMLYINCNVNGHPVKAFVDSGAQMTIMSQACAERCNIMRLVDRRWAGIAKGVGTQKIIGRVHLAQVQIEGDYLPCSFSILEDQPMDMLLGLDMLKRHQCAIDLKKSVLLIGTTGTETRFLPEAELPDCARMAYGTEGREDARPEEMADRELAEALQRSIQESDTADGQTTSQTSPPFPVPEPLDQMASSIPSSSSSSQPPSRRGHPQSLALDRSQSAPASMHAPPPGRHQSQPGFQGLPGPSYQEEESISASNQVNPQPLPATTSSHSSPLTNPPTDDLPKSTSPQDKGASGIPGFGDPENEVPSATTEMDTECIGLPKSSMLPGQEELSPVQPMERDLPPLDEPVSSSESGVPFTATEMEAEFVGVENGSMPTNLEELSPFQHVEKDTPPPETPANCSLAFGEPKCEVPSTVTEMDAESDEAENFSEFTNPEGFSPVQAMEEEEDAEGSGTAAEATQPCLSATGQQNHEGDGTHEHQPVPMSLDLGSSPADSPPETDVTPDPHCADNAPVPSERDQPEGERSPGPENIPSLAAALMELHQLLVSSSHGQERGASCSPSRPFRQDADGLDDGNPEPEPPAPPPESTQPTPSTAIIAGADPCDAKANLAAVSDEGLPARVDGHPGRDAAETAEGHGPQQCPDGPWERRPARSGRDDDDVGDATAAGASGPEPAAPSAQTGDLEFREPPEGQQGHQGRGVADGSASGSDSPDEPEHARQSPLFMAGGSSAEAPTTSPSAPSTPSLAQAPHAASLAPLPLPPPPSSAPRPFTEPFPAEHIQRIQAAGFSAGEAAEALERAHGIVELALLTLLARSITVPT